MTFFSLIRQVCVCNNTTLSPPQEQRSSGSRPRRLAKPDHYPSQPFTGPPDVRQLARYRRGAENQPSAFRRRLDGQWQFSWPAARLTWMPAGWKTICRTAAVRRCRQTGKWKATTPDLYQRPLPDRHYAAARPEENPTGCYSLTFSVDESWRADGQTQIIFDGVNSAICGATANGSVIRRTVACPRPSISRPTFSRAITASA
jgi:hypothetical protein